MHCYNKTQKRFVILFYGSFFMLLGMYANSGNQFVFVNGCIPEIDFPGGRIAMSFDGNQHDPDDVGALPMSLAFTWAAGLQNNVVFVEHSNHICNVNNVLHGKMQESAAGCIERFGYDANIIHDFYSNPTAVTEKFVVAINKSTANNPLWIIAAGPMESIWRAISRADKHVLPYVSIISHSGWNETHGDCGDDSHNWTDLQVFEKNNGLNLIEITDQNHSNGENDFSTPRHKWDWLRDSEDSNLAWVYSRDQFTSGEFMKFDPSDSGMVYWLISGGPNNGNERGGPNEAQKLFENPCIDDVLVTRPMISLKSPSGDHEVSEGYKLYVEVEVSDPDGVEKAEIFINEKSIRSERVAPYEWGYNGPRDTNELNGLPVGEHEIKIIATDNVGTTNETSFILRVLETSLGTTSKADDNPLVVFPNPSSSGVFSLSEKVNWELFAMNGSKVLQGNSKTIVHSGLSAGLYFLKVHFGTSSGTLQLLVR